MGIGDQIISILDYDGNVLDCWINYTLLPCNLAPIIMLLQTIPSSGNEISQYRRFWAPLTIGLFIYQILLCVVVGCVGVSIVWSSFAGFYWFFLGIRQLLPSTNTFNTTWKFAGYLSSVPTIGALIYYAITEELLTSVAHLCAILLGFLIAELFYRSLSKKLDAPLLNQAESKGSR